MGREAAVLFDKTHTVTANAGMPPTTLVANLVVASFNNSQNFGRAAGMLGQSNGRAFLFEGDAGLVEVSESYARPQQKICPDMSENLYVNVIYRTFCHDFGAHQ
eukprot:COSAG05_NODE_7417_length_813_cov_1.407563_2_plen_103_part_01